MKIDYLSNKMSGEDKPLRSALEIALERAEQIAQSPPKPAKSPELEIVKHKSNDIRVIQFGGSVIGYHLSDPNPYEAMMSVLNVFIEGKANGMPIVLTAGGGPSLDLIRYYDTEFKFNRYDEMYFNAVCLNAKLLAGLLGEHGEYLTPRYLGKVNLEYLLQKIPVFSHAEEPWQRPFSADREAVLLADHFRTPNVIMMRDVDGIYAWDPKTDSRERLEEAVLRREAYVEYVRKIRQVVPDEDIAARKKEGRKRYLIKIGGSGFDLVFYRTNPQVLTSFLSALVGLHRDYDIILTVGGGPSQDIAKRFRDAMRIDDKIYQDISYHALKIHALLVAGMLERFGEYVPPEDIGKVDGNYLREKIPVFSHVPSYVGHDLFGMDIPNSESDAQTNALGEFFGVEGILYAKNTPGIFLRDPNIEPRLSMEDIIRRISVQDIRSRISRIGEDRMDEHLIENFGLDIFERSRKPRYICVIDIRGSALVGTAFLGGEAGSVIYRN